MKYKFKPIEEFGYKIEFSSMIAAIPIEADEEAKELLTGADGLVFGIQSWDNDPRKYVNLYLFRKEVPVCKTQIVTGAVGGVYADESKLGVVDLAMNESRLAELIRNCFKTRILLATV